MHRWHRNNTVLAGCSVTIVILILTILGIYIIVCYTYNVVPEPLHETISWTRKLKRKWIAKRIKTDSEEWRNVKSLRTASFRRGHSGQELVDVRYRNAAITYNLRIFSWWKVYRILSFFFHCYFVYYITFVKPTGHRL